MSNSQAPTAMPRIRRARGFRLYDVQGRRFLDLYREGALLGHRSASALTAMKAGLASGLATGLPSAWEERLRAALVRLFPAYPVVRIFSSRARALAAFSIAEAPYDPAMAPAAAAPLAAPQAPAAALWRPFLPAPAGARVLLPVLPLTMCGAPAPACVAGPTDQGLPCSDHLPGFLLAGALRALAALAADPPARPFSRLGNPLIEGALDKAPGWARVGPYVRAVFPAEDYPRVHAEFLRAGVLLSPFYPGPSILPGDCSPGKIDSWRTSSPGILEADMDSIAFSQYASHLVLGAFATFSAILLWSRTRDMAWTFLIIGAIVSYADIVFSTLRGFGVLGGDLLSFSGYPVLQLALANIPLLFFGIGFLIAVSRRSHP